MTDAPCSEKRLRVLAVDDEPDDRAMVVREAEALAAHVEVAEAGTREEFEAALHNGPYDLVVTDLALKWGTGREVFARVREGMPGTPVVMFTDSGDETTAVDLMKAGLDDYVVKSVRQLPRLRASMTIAIEGARSRSVLTERERQLASALAHQRVIVQELHHRVKNNLQIINSLLQLRAKARGGEVAAELEDLAGRMRALAAVQARIYDTEALDKVDVAAALSEMAESLVTLRGDEHVGLVCEVDGPFVLEVGRAMPLGLLFYELVLNALKHAWPDGRAGRLIVKIKARREPPEIKVCDNGVGFVDGDVVKGLGTRLLRALAAEARVEVRTVSQPGDGTAVSLQLI